MFTLRRSLKRKTSGIIILLLIPLLALTIYFLPQTLKDSPNGSSEDTRHSVISFSLIDADTDLTITSFHSINNDTTINLSSLRTTNLNIRANTEPPVVGSVVFKLNTSIFNIENSPPYSLAGDSPSGEYTAWTPTPGWHNLSATPYTNSSGTGESGTPLTITFNVVADPIDEQGPLPSQLIVDPQHPEWLRYHLGPPFFMCGPGDPEDFLYRGSINLNGTRNGDQMNLIEKLRDTGANSIYLQAIRSHGGDGDSTQNPFLDNVPTKGLNQDILTQWEVWFTAMDNANITIFFFLYDDGAVIWDTGDLVGSEERAFIHELVDRFEHHKHLIWVVAEEYGRVYTEARVSNIAAEIRSADDHDHPISVHHNSDAPMGFPDDPNVDQYAIQYYSVFDRDELHNIVVSAWNEADGRYNLNLAEADQWGSGETARKKSWAVAMGGAYVMILGMDIDGTPIKDLEDCGRLVRFMESANFNEMAPHDELAFAGTEYVLALPGDSYIAYASALSGEIGLRNMFPGIYTFLWYDVTNNATVLQEWVHVNSGDQTWPTPNGVGNELAVYIKRIVDGVDHPTVFPGVNWEVKKPEDLGMDSSPLDEIAVTLGGNGLIVKDGYIVKTWGEQSEIHYWASSSKPVLSTLLLFAVKEGRLQSVDSLVKDWGWDLNAKDQNMTFRHLANMVSGYARPEAPGEVYAYNDPAIQLYFLTLERVFQQTINDAAMTRLHSPLNLEGPYVFLPRGRVDLSLQDFARLCWFWLNKGNWDGIQLLPSIFFDEYMKPGVSSDLPFAPYDLYVDDYLNVGTYGAAETSQDWLYGSGIYGFNWWLNAPGRLRNGTSFNLTWPDAPNDTGMTIGAGGNNSIIIPSLGIILVSAESDWGDAIINPTQNEVMKLLAESVNG